MTYFKTYNFVLSILLIFGCGGRKTINKLTTPNNRPNILLIMADDMGYSDIGCYGSEIQTPNLDELAYNGLRYSQFYNCARCCPTRASLLTGLYPHQTGIGRMMNDLGHESYRGDLNNNCVTIAEVLQQAGYSTYLSGKWHVTRFMDPAGTKHNWPLQRGFDRFFGNLDGFGAGGYYHTKTLTSNNTSLPVPDDNFYYTDAITDSASQMLSWHFSREKGNPFFMYLAYTAPHWPLQALDGDISKYKGKYDKGWDAVRQKRYENLVKIGLIDKRFEITKRDESVPEWGKAKNKPWEARRMEVHAAMVDRMDQGIGKILKVLKKNNQLDNTVIFFLSDNGGSAEDLLPFGWWLENLPTETPAGEVIHRFNLPDIMAGADTTFQSIGIPWANVSNTPFKKYKRYLHEGGIASPLIVHWPDGIRAKGELRNQPGNVMDIMATCVELANTSYPSRFKGHEIIRLEGFSLVGSFADTVVQKRTMFWEHLGRRAIRKDDFKLVSEGLAGKGNWELYDLSEDRTETNNIIAQDPEIAGQLSNEWEEWSQKVKALPKVHRR